MWARVIQMTVKVGEDDLKPDHGVYQPGIPGKPWKSQGNPGVTPGIL